MKLIALGINHNSAAVEVRERVAFAPEQVSEALADACTAAGVDEVVILSTCNRTELYAIVPAGISLADTAKQLIDWVANYHHLSAEELRQAEEALNQADARIASLMIDLERHSSVAPVDCVVDSLLFEVGERPAIGQPMAILLSGQQPYARVFVPEVTRVQVAPGTRARIFVDGLDEALDGRVRWVASEAAFTPYFALTEHDRGRLSFVAKVDVLNATSRLPDGVPVEVELLIGNTSE